MVNENAMQSGAADAIREATREDSFGFFRAADETNAAEGIDVFRGNFDAKFAQRIEAVGHEALAARFIDGWNCSIGDDHAQAATARGDADSEAGRSSPDHEHINRIWQMA